MFCVSLFWHDTLFSMTQILSLSLSLFYLLLYLEYMKNVRLTSPINFSLLIISLYPVCSRSWEVEREREGGRERDTESNKGVSVSTPQVPDNYQLLWVFVCVCVCLTSAAKVNLYDFSVNKSTCTPYLNSHYSAKKCEKIHFLDSLNPGVLYASQTDRQTYGLSQAGSDHLSCARMDNCPLPHTLSQPIKAWQHFFRTWRK